MDPIAALQEQLAEHKQAGERFDRAWSIALGEIVAPRSGTTARQEHNLIIGALHATRDTWERAYLGQPVTPGERACRALWQALDGELTCSQRRDSLRRPSRRWCGCTTPDPG